MPDLTLPEPTGPVMESPLLDLAHTRLNALRAGDEETVLDTVMRRLFDPRKRNTVTVSAFQSAL
ncbi:FxSxx-COOH cyclophane-containing RiPP peptide [Dactylosporangium sp. NPDC000244]|uniref:FxSxx-COOH cyclophane-containing RiPP peptide n=1 Tax=Dactylosporangium sp. NPDC000244 TaxID=3154365 RepID=UPI0033313B00